MLGALRFEYSLHASGYRGELAICQRESTKIQRSPTGYWNWDATENIPGLVDGMITHNTSTMDATIFPLLTTSLFSLYIAFKSSHHPPVLSSCPLQTNSGCGKERRILIGPR